MNIKKVIIITTIIIAVSIICVVFLLPDNEVKFSTPDSNIVTIKYATPDDLQLTISSEKNIINKTQNESLLVTIQLTNICDFILFIYYDFSINGILEFNILTPSNYTIYPIHPNIDFTEKVIYGNVTMNPSESINTTVDIFNYEYSLDQREDNSDLYDWNETGRYRIQFIYENFDSEYEIIESNVIEFELIN